MSAGEGQQAQGEGQEVSGEVNSQAELEKLKATNNRLLAESQEWKARFKDEMAAKERATKEQLEKDGNLKGLAEQLQKENQKLKEELGSTRSKVLKANIRSKVARFAGEVHDLEDVLNQPQFKDVLQTGIDQENLELNDDAAKNYVSEVLKAKPWLRKAPGPMNVNTNKPASSTSSGASFSEMSLEELKKYAIQNFKN
jgi:HPt (histidine-containing phosphotransfer) domain-containing protein